MQKTITQNDLENKRVLVRVDFNVPIDNGIIQDNTRIKNAYRTIKYLKEAKAKIILISHLGKTTSPCSAQSMKQIAGEVEKEYSSKVIFIDDYMNDSVDKIINATSIDDIILLENLRFHVEEEKCDIEFAKRIAGFADFYINEAFSVSHRKHASVFEIPQILPHALGLSFINEIHVIDNFFQNAESPKMCIIGGSKLSTKVGLLKNLVKKVDKLAIGGWIAGAFAHSYKIPDFEDYKDDVIEVIENSKRYNCELIMPSDSIALVKSKTSVFDIGPDSVELFRRHIKTSKMILWNGPVGLFEKTPFDFGTMSIAKYIAQLTKNGELTSIIGGGDTCFAVNKLSAASDFTHVSTAGGAFLSYIESGTLAGITAMGNPHILS